MAAANRKKDAADADDDAAGAANGAEGDGPTIASLNF